MRSVPAFGWCLGASIAALGCASTPPTNALVQTTDRPQSANEPAHPLPIGEPAITPSPSASAEPPRPPTASPARIDVGAPWVLGDPHTPPANEVAASLGPLSHEPPADPTHALPRVIIDVKKSIGPVKAEAIQAKARSGFWGKVIECYRPGAVKDQSLRGETTLRVTIAKGEVRKAKVLAPMPDKDVSACLAKKLVGLEMPKGRGSSNATMKIHVAPGDEPMPPLDDAITRGPGEVDVAKVHDTIAASGPALLGCYRSSLDYAPELRGPLLVRIQIAPDGTMGEAFESGARFPDDRLARCVLHVIRALVNDPPRKGSVRLYVPLTFTPAIPPTPSAPTPSAPTPSAPTPSAESR